MVGSTTLPHIRLAVPDDAGAIREIYRPAIESSVISFELDVPSEADMGTRITETLRFHPWLVCEERGIVAGYAYATTHRVRAAYRWSVDTAVYVHDAFRRRGVGRGLYTSLFQILTAQGYVNAYAGITLPNAASVALHESVGFRPLGVYREVGYKCGAWHDVGWWELALQPHRLDPPSPVGLQNVMSDVRRPAWLAAGCAHIRERPHDAPAV